ncbi:unnamed protein product [Arctia plantaginis]|uniref:Uncharacterized protein n=1 Tax=Arctia plantaginis TaxID=874455 RepID=A0A8S1A797_ARCPL|nr:unnamed protein product [Arctia plantaginis]CAB3251196.1 unnamed protein product [Arctia plantaginis]
MCLVVIQSPAFADGARIYSYNLDETATSTVQKNLRVLAPKGQRNILTKESGDTVLTLHTHTSAKLQPLDVDIHEPFKSYYE